MVFAAGAPWDLRGKKAGVVAVYPIQEKAEGGMRLAQL
jgi:hypothetical protein